MTEPKKKKRSPAQGIPIKRIVPAPEVDTINPEDIYDEPSPDEIADMEKLDLLRSQFGGRQYTIRVERYNEETSEMEIVDRIQFDTFDHFILGRRYGGGKFVCTLFNEKGKYVEGGRFHFNFAKPKESDRPASPLQDPTMQAFVENMKATQAMMVEILKTTLTGEKQTPIDQLVSALKGLHEMNPQKTENPFKNVKELLEITSMLKNSSEPEEKEEGMKGILGEIVEAAKILSQGRHVPVPGALRSMGGLPILKRPQASSPPVEKEEVKPVSDPVLKKLLVHAPHFEEAAQENQDPEKWAGYLLDVLETQIVPALVKKYAPFVDEDGVWDRLIDSSQNEEKVNKIFEFIPTLEPHKEWVLKVIEAAVRQFDGDEAPPLKTHVNGEGEGE